MFKRVFTIALSVLLGSISQTMQLQAMFIPSPEEHDEYQSFFREHDRNLAEQASRECEQATSCFGMIQDDDCLAGLIVDQLLQEVMNEAGWTKSHAINNELIDTLKAFNESEATRLSVQRKVLVNLVDICDANFRALSNEAKDAYLVEELMELLKNNVDYQTHFKRWIINLQEKIAANATAIKQKIQSKVQAFVAAHPGLINNALSISCGMLSGLFDVSFVCFAKTCLTAIVLGSCASGAILAGAPLSEIPNFLQTQFYSEPWPDEFNSAMMKIDALTCVILTVTHAILVSNMGLNIKFFASGELLTTICLFYLCNGFPSYI